MFYLKNFGERIYLYYKQTNKISPSTPKEVAFQRNFYAYSNDTALKLEEAMAQFEGKASTVISDIIRTESIAELSNEARATLCAFAAFQSVRTPEFRNSRYYTIQSMLDELVRQMGVTDWRIVEDSKSAHLASIPDGVDTVGLHLSQMGTCLIKNNTDVPLWTSDNPIVRYNGLTGKLGAGSPGVQFYLPLSPKLLLMFYDGTYIDLLNDAAGDAGIAKRRVWERKQTVLETVNMDKASVIRANRLQTIYSTGSIYSNKPDFDMIEEFLGQGWSGLLDGAHPLRSNLQNALWWYREGVYATDMRRAFMVLYDSLRMVTNIGGIWDEDEEAFDNNVRKLADDPELPIDEVRQFYNRIKSNEHPDSHVNDAQMAKQIKKLRRIVAKAMLRRIDESRTWPLKHAD